MLKNTIAALLLGFITSVLATGLHFESLSRLSRSADSCVRQPRRVVLLTLISVVATHLLEIGVFTCAVALSIGPLQLGALRGLAHDSPAALFYVAAETFSSLGFGDIVPTASLRLLTSLTSLTGILLLAWSGSYLFALAQRFHNDRSK